MKYLLCVAVIATSFSGLANADNGVYTSLKAGISDTKLKNSSSHYIDYDNTYFSRNETKSTYPTISAAVGYDFSAISPVTARAELEYTYKGKTTFSPDFYAEIYAGNFDDYNSESWFQNKLTTQSLMLNGYYDFKNTSKFTPYVSAGVGITRVKNEITELDYQVTQSDSDNHFTWSAGVGVNYAVSQNVGLDLSYRYVDAGKFKFNTNLDGDNVESKFKLSSNEYLLGIRYNF